MKAFLLAAGEGTRLRPLTETIPKCLIPIQGKPLLHHWLLLCKSYGITEVLINTHHLADQVVDFLRVQNTGLRVVAFHEETLLGTAGTVGSNRWFVRDEEHFFILYADNLTKVNLLKFLDFHRKHHAMFSMGLFRANRPTECGIATLNNNDLIVEFTEKPRRPKSNLANAGMYIADQRLFDFIPSDGVTDFGFDVLPMLVNQMHGYVVKEYLIDIGTPENYQRAQEEWRE